MVYICAQPATFYYAWQVDAMLLSFEKNGNINLHNVHIIGAIKHDKIHERYRRVDEKWTKKGVLFKVEIQAKENSTLGVHIHQYGDCGDIEGKNAGGHWNPTDEPHGTWSQGSFHSGDLGNIKTDQNGNGALEVLDVFGRWSLDKEKTTSVLNKAIIVHAGTDDMTTQPSGAAGKRMGCGVIKNSK